MKKATELSTEQLYRPCDLAALDFSTTEELESAEQMLGQDRAVEAIRFGADINLHGFNVFVLGPPGTGRHSFVRRFLKAKACDMPPPSDWIYVNNFAEPRTPRALELPASAR